MAMYQYDGRSFGELWKLFRLKNCAKGGHLFSWVLNRALVSSQLQIFWYGVESCVIHSSLQNKSLTWILSSNVSLSSGHVVCNSFGKKGCYIFITVFISSPRCVDWSHQGLAFSIFHFVCPRGTIFDEETQICNFPSKTKPCLVSNNDQTFAHNQTCLGLNCPQTVNTSTDSTIMMSTEQSTTTAGMSVEEVTSTVFMPAEINSTTSASSSEFTSNWPTFLLYILW